MLKFIFDSGDDRFSEISILRVTPTTEGARVRVGAARERSTTNPQGVVSTTRSRLTASLIFAKEIGRQIQSSRSWVGRRHRGGSRRASTGLPSADD
jgi:hypothetical protein